MTFVTGEAAGWIKGFFSPQSLALMIIDMAVSYWIEQRERKVAEDALRARISFDDVHERAIAFIASERAAIARAQVRGGQYFLNLHFHIPAVNQMVRDVRFAGVSGSLENQKQWSTTVMSHGMPFFGSASEETMTYVTVSQPLPKLELSQTEINELKIEHAEEQLEALRAKRGDVFARGRLSRDLGRLRASRPQAEAADARDAAERERKATADLGRASVSDNPAKRAEQQRQLQDRIAKLPQGTATPPRPASPQSQTQPPTPQQQGLAQSGPVDFLQQRPAPLWNGGLPGAPSGPSQSQEIDYADGLVRFYTTWAANLDRQGQGLRSSPEATRLAWCDAETSWHFQIKALMNEYSNKTSLNAAVQALGTLLTRQGDALRQLRIQLGGSAQP